METNFVGVMHPLFTEIKFTFHPQRCFLLHKLSKKEAVKIVRLMAEREKIPFEPEFVDRLTEKSGSNAKEEVSPVVLQITVHTIRFSRQSEGERAFTTRAIEQRGGIEGIYECVLEGELQKLDQESRHIAEQILKALIDWNKGTRAGALTREELKPNMDVGQIAQKMQDHRRPIKMRDLSVQKLDDALTWLCTCRFIRKSHRRGVDTYELDQDWLMRVVINREAEYIGERHKAERLLTQGYEPWRENNREDHYLLSPSALERIEPYQQQLDLDADKSDFIAKSRKSVWRKKRDMLAIGGAIVFGLVVTVVMLYPQFFRPLKYAQSELLELSKQTRKPETRSEIAKALFFAKNFEGAREVIGRVADDWDKDVARSEIVKAASPYNYALLRDEAKDLAASIRDDSERTIALRLLEESKFDRDDAFEHPSNRDQPTSTLDLITKPGSDAALESDPIEKLDVMAALVQAAAHRAQNANGVLPEKKVQAVLKEMEQQLEVINNVPMDFRTFRGRRSAAEIAAYLNDGKRAFKILYEAKESTPQISAVHERTLAMRSIAIVAAHFALLMVHDCHKSTCALSQVDDLLKLANEAKDAITEDGEKYAPLSSIVEAQVARAGFSKSLDDLEKARITAKEIHSKAHLSSALRLIVTEMVKRGHEREAVAIAKQNETDVKADLLANILLAYADKTYPKKSKNYHFQHLPKTAPVDMIAIPAGPFTMGSMKGERTERPEHTVYVDSFSLDKSETTVELYNKFLKETDRVPPGYWKENWKNEIPLHDREKPVVGVTWGEASAYCRWKQKRLPTEAEWEKAARGTKKQKYPWGNLGADGNGRANFNQPDPGDDPYAVLKKVGSFENMGGDSPYAIHDMAGNAWEWVEDWYDASMYVDIHSGGYPASSIGDMKILRGGAWDNTDKDDRLRSTFRLARYPKDSYGTYGFRCAQSIDAPLDDGPQLPSQR